MATTVASGVFTMKDFKDTSKAYAAAGHHCALGALRQEHSGLVSGRQAMRLARSAASCRGARSQFSAMPKVGRWLLWAAERRTMGRLQGVKRMQSK